MDIEGPGRIDGPAESEGTYDATVVLEVDGVEPETGVEGWTFGIASDRATIIEATVEGTAGADKADGGLRSDGFEATRLTEDGGVVSAVVLSFREAIVAGRGKTNVLRVKTRVTYPVEDDDCNEARLSIASGLRGPGEPVPVLVTYDGRTREVEMGELVTQFCPLGPYNLDIAGETSAAVAPGVSEVALRPYCRMLADEEGVQGWSISVESRGDCELRGASIDGTIGADVGDGGLRNTGFEKTELALPENNGGRNGAVSAIILSFTMPLTVPAGEHNLLNLDVACDTSGAVDGDVITHEIFYPANNGSPPESGQLTGAGQPVKTAVTVEGVTIEPGIRGSRLEVTVRAPQIANFVRCDPNDDGLNNLADAVWLVNELFRQGQQTQCRDAGDCNDDELVDLSDAVFAIEYQFIGGAAPTAPFPECGVDDDVSETSCPEGSTTCP